MKPPRRKKRNNKNTRKTKRGGHTAGYSGGIAGLSSYSLGKTLGGGIARYPLNLTTKLLLVFCERALHTANPQNQSAEKFLRKLLLVYREPIRLQKIVSVLLCDGIAHSKPIGVQKTASVGKPRVWDGYSAFPWVLRYTPQLGPTPRRN